MSLNKGDSKSTAHVIGRSILEKIYKYTMSSMLKAIRASAGGAFGIAGANNRLSKSKNKVLMRTPMLLFVKYLKEDIRREKSINVVSKSKTALKALTISSD